MSPKNIHLIFALLSCLWDSIVNVSEKNNFPECSFTVETLDFHDDPTSLIKGLPKKIIIENVSGNVDYVKVSYLRPAVGGTASLYNSSQRPDDLFKVGESTAMFSEWVLPSGENEITSFLTSMRKA